MSDVTDLEAALTDDDRAFLDELADAISKRRLASAAMFLLESLEPLNFLGASMMTFLRPIVGMVWTDPARWDRVQRLLEHRGAIGLLLRRLEARA